MSSIRYQTRFRINQPVDELFPLFSAEGEKHWVPGWDYENVMGSTDIHEDYIFLTSGHHGSGHHHSSAKQIWLVKRYEPSIYFIQFYRVEPVHRVVIISVRCEPLTAASTEVDVGYEFVGLSKEGDDFINGYTSEEFEASIHKWSVWLVDYFDANPS